jgi:hypothetical protein
VTDAAALAAAAAYGAGRRALLVADAPRDAASTGAAAAAAGALPASDHVAVYHPWLDAPDPLAGGRPRRCAPCGAVAGLYARTDAARGVWRAPAGLEAALTGVLAPAVALSDDEQAVLTAAGVNAIRTFAGKGSLVWGARTRAPAGDPFLFVPVRRLALYVEASLAAGLAWTAFAPSGEPLWAEVRLRAEAFLHGLFRQGAFAGATPQASYFVRCDAGTTSAADRAAGLVTLLVGIAPLRAAEFIVLRLQLVAGPET